MYLSMWFQILSELSYSASHPYTYSVSFSCLLETKKKLLVLWYVLILNSAQATSPEIPSCSFHFYLLWISLWLYLVSNEILNLCLLICRSQLTQGRKVLLMIDMISKLVNRVNLWILWIILFYVGVNHVKLYLVLSEWSCVLDCQNWLSVWTTEKAFSRALINYLMMELMWVYMI